MSAPDMERHRRTLDIGVRALALVTQHRTSADPTAYEVWYEYVNGHEVLVEQVKALVAQGSLSNADLQKLHASHLSPIRTSQRIDEIGAGTQDEVRSLLGSVKTTIADLSGMEAELQSTADRLAQPGLPSDTLRGLLDVAVATTRKVCERSAGLEARLVESEASIAALHLALEEARDEAIRDSLTGLYNRRAFDTRFKDCFDTASARNLPLCLIMLDIDHFKSFNDSHGHPVGDQVIRVVGGYLKERIAAPDLPARYGGEEFAIVAVGRSLPEAMELAEEIRRKVECDGLTMLGPKQTRAKVTVSAGVASRRPGDTCATLLERADERVYAAKRLGRNRVSADIATYPEQAEIEERRETGRLGLRALKSLVGAGPRLGRWAIDIVQRRSRPRPAVPARR